MNPMDRVTLHGLFIWGVFIACPLAALALIRRRRRKRWQRANQAWAARVAQGARDGEYLRWLEANWDDDAGVDIFDGEEDMT